MNAIPIQDSADSAIAEAESALTRLIEESRRTRQAYATIRDQKHQPDQRYCDDIWVSLVMTEFDVSLARAEREVQSASGAKELQSSISAMVDATRGWFDDVAVRSRLARMDARDRTTAVGEHLERAAAEARRVSTRISDALEGDLTDVRRIAMEGIGAVRSSLGGAMHAVRNP